MKPEISYYGTQKNTRREDYPEVGVTLWYSYDTVVAFRVSGQDKVVSENVWGTTTGKHLNWIDEGDKKNRLPYAEYKRLLNEATANL